MPEPIALDNGDKLTFIGCEIIYREACKLAAESRLRVDLRFLPKGLHDLERADMQSRLQAAVDDVDTDTNRAIILGYARCNDGLSGLTARDVPLVIPKAHDCITFFFGGRRAYREYFDTHPGTYCRTTGWCERENPEVEGSQGVMAQLGLDRGYEELVEQYGKENADYIRETMGDGLQNYSRICYLRMGVTDETPFVDASRREAEERGWEFEEREGDWSILDRLFNGQWDGDDFLVVRPGERIVPRNDESVLGTSP